MENNNKKNIINHILVPVDFSDYSLNACYFALHLSSRLGADIKLFHAFFNPMIDAMAFPDAYTYQSNMTEIFMELEQNAEKEMKLFTKKIKRYATLKELKEVKINTEVISGQPGFEIENTINSYHPDIIIIGTKGQGKQSSDILGSVAAKVIDSSGIPVLLVTKDARIDEDEKIKVLYATNFDDSDYLAIQSLITILSGFSIMINCVHFHGNTDKSNDKEKMNEMKKYFSEKYKEISLECSIIGSEDIVSGLKNFVQSNDIDLIALTHKKRNFFYRLFNPSLAKKLLFNTSKPVFVFN